MLLDSSGKLEIASQADRRCDYNKSNRFFLIFSVHVGLPAR